MDGYISMKNPTKVSGKSTGGSGELESGILSSMRSSPFCLISLLKTGSGTSKRLINE